MVSVRAKGWLGFKYYGPKLHELKLRSGGGFGNKNKIVQKIIQNCQKKLQLKMTNEPDWGNQ